MKSEGVPANERVDVRQPLLRRELPRAPHYRMRALTHKYTARSLQPTHTHTHTHNRLHRERDAAWVAQLVVPSSLPSSLYRPFHIFRCTGEEEEELIWNRDQ